MKSFKHTLAFVACTLAASVSYAEPMKVTVTFDGTPGGTGIFEGSKYSTATITHRDSSGAVKRNISVYAGRFQGTGSEVQGVPELVFVDSLDNLFLYCYDIYDGIDSGNKVVYNINLAGEKDRTLDFLGAVNSVLSGPANDPFAWLHSSSIAIKGVAAAIQIGIWESKYETSDAWNLGLGSFSATSLDNETKAWLSSFIGAIEDSESLDAKYVMVLENPLKQDMITGDPIPEPGSLALLGLGLGGLAFAQRKRAKRAA